MKKIAVITFFQSQDNYGQLLQAFALQRVLSKMGHRAEVIRYGFHKKYYHWFRLCNFTTKPGIYQLLVHLGIIRSEQERTYHDRSFDSFRRMYIKQTLRCYNNLNELKANPPKADIYITGSDQVWAQLLSRKDNRSFFLDFGKKETKRIAYAPSFAIKEYPLELENELKDALKSFNAVSVREPLGIDICKRVGVTAKLVLDPTLLLDIEDYNKMIKLPTQKNYCFAYHVNIDKPSGLFWDDFSIYNQFNNIKTIATFANPTCNINFEFLQGAEYIYPTIQEWLGYIRNAKYVLTTSFHGVVFSILFHVPFIVCLRQESVFAGNDRVTNLLNLLGLTDCIMTIDKSIDQILMKKISWVDVDARLSAMRKESLSFLINCIKDESPF